MSTNNTKRFSNNHRNMKGESSAWTAESFGVSINSPTKSNSRQANQNQNNLQTPKTVSRFQSQQQTPKSSRVYNGKSNGGSRLFAELDTNTLNRHNDSSSNSANLSSSVADQLLSSCDVAILGDDAILNAGAACMNSPPSRHASLSSCSIDSPPASSTVPANECLSIHVTPPQHEQHAMSSAYAQHQYTASPAYYPSPYSSKGGLMSELSCNTNLPYGTQASHGTPGGYEYDPYAQQHQQPHHHQQFGVSMQQQQPSPYYMWPPPAQYATAQTGAYNECFHSPLTSSMSPQQQQQQPQYYASPMPSSVGPSHMAALGGASPAPPTNGPAVPFAYDPNVAAAAAMAYTNMMASNTYSPQQPQMSAVYHTPRPANSQLQYLAQHQQMIASPQQQHQQANDSSSMPAVFGSDQYNNSAPQTTLYQTSAFNQSQQQQATPTAPYMISYSQTNPYLTPASANCFMSPSPISPMQHQQQQPQGTYGAHLQMTPVSTSSLNTANSFYNRGGYCTGANSPVVPTSFNSRYNKSNRYQNNSLNSSSSPNPLNKRNYTNYHQKYTNYMEQMTQSPGGPDLQLPFSSDATNSQNMYVPIQTLSPCVNSTGSSSGNESPCDGDVDSCADVNNNGGGAMMSMYNDGTATYDHVATQPMYGNSGQVESYGEDDYDYDDGTAMDDEQLACQVCRGRRMCFCYFLKVRYYKFPSFFDLVDHQYKKWRASMAKAGLNLPQPTQLHLQ